MHLLNMSSQQFEIFWICIMIYMRYLPHVTNVLTNEPPTVDIESRAVRTASGPDEAGRRGQGETEARSEFPVQLAEQGARSLQVPRGRCVPRRVCVPPAQQIQRHVGGE